MEELALEQMRETSEVKTLIVGLGKTGLSCARYLAARGVSAAITDSAISHPVWQH